MIQKAVTVSTLSRERRNKRRVRLLSVGPHRENVSARTKDDGVLLVIICIAITMLFSVLFLSRLVRFLSSEYVGFSFPCSEPNLNKVVMGQ